jgi:3',5'-cyclic AMP phosphodiesterase CpdA
LRTLVHLSDIHFGRVNYATVEPVLEAVWRARPDLVAISGDFTQRARRHEFKEARAFLDALPQPQIVVPGNHDIPLHNLYARFVRKFDYYAEYISADLEPFFLDDELVVAGINTARHTTWKGGRINRTQILKAHDRLCGHGEDRIRIVVTHHPFELPKGMSDSSLVGRAHMAMQKFADCGADLFLAGHLHLGYTAHTAERYDIAGHSALVVQAGTATSSRGRGEQNSFNIIKIARPSISVERFVWEPESGQFQTAELQNFRLDHGVWRGD